MSTRTYPKAVPAVSIGHVTFVVEIDLVDCGLSEYVLAGVEVQSPELNVYDQYGWA